MIACVFCDEEVDDTEFDPRAQPSHRDCLIRAVAGGLNHQLGLCSCCGGNLPPDPPSMSKREAARLAAAHFRAKAPL